MYLIIGLGNPGKDYKNTRHNIGFDVIETLAEEERIGVLEKKHKAVIGKGVIAGQKVLLAMPQTYMNLSGESVRELVDYYKVDETCEVIVISDDISLAPGQIRIRKKGCHSLVRCNVCRKGFSIIYFTQDERKIMDEAAKEACEAIRMILSDDIDKAMNRFNAKKG